MVQILGNFGPDSLEPESEEPLEMIEYGICEMCGTKWRRRHHPGASIVVYEKWSHLMPEIQIGGQILSIRFGPGLGRWVKVKTSPVKSDNLQGN